MAVVRADGHCTEQWAIEEPEPVPMTSFTEFFPQHATPSTPPTVTRWPQKGCVA